MLFNLVDDFCLTRYTMLPLKFHFLTSRRMMREREKGLLVKETTWPPLMMTKQWKGKSTSVHKTLGTIKPQANNKVWPVLIVG